MVVLQQMLGVGISSVGRLNNNNSQRHDRSSKNYRYESLPTNEEDENDDVILAEMDKNWRRNATGRIKGWLRSINNSKTPVQGNE